MNSNARFTPITDLLKNWKRLLAGKTDRQSLADRATRSAVWIGSGFVFQRGLQFASNLILTRLLFPEAFGLMALCTVFLVGLAMFSDLGLKPAIIRDARGDDPVFLNTAWTIQVIRGLVLFISGCLLAFPISIIYDNPILFPLLAVISLTSLITGFSSIKMVTAERNLDYQNITIVNIGGQIVQLVAIIVLAYFWRSVWALAVGGIIGSLSTLLTGHLLLRGHRHQLKIDRTSAYSLINFGKWIFLSTVVTFLGGEGLRAIQAGLVTPAQFGILAIAYSIAIIPADLSLKLTASVGLPALSESFRNNPDNLPKVLNNFRKRLFLLLFTLVLAVVITSEALVKVLYDARYHDAGIYAVAFTLANAVTLISAGYDNALLALGKSKIYLWMMAIGTIGRIVGTVIGLEMFGILGMILGIGIGNLFVLPGYWTIMQKLRLRNFKLDSVVLITIVILTIAVVTI